jgi:predicted kinase
MKKLYIMVGIPGSGKTTWVTDNFGGMDVLTNPKSPVKYLNADSIRKELYGDERIQGNPNTVFDILFKRFRAALIDKNIGTIIVDNTSPDFKQRNKYYQIIEEEELRESVTIELIIFNNHAQAYERNRNRDRVVPEEVLDRMVAKFDAPLTFEIADGIDYRIIS